jgi:hypothetical protein
MGLAYEKATVGLDEISDREIVAMRVIEAARSGERELDNLVAYAPWMDSIGGPNLRVKAPSQCGTR